jgi:hypothetical protein
VSADSRLPPSGLFLAWDAGSACLYMYITKSGQLVWGSALSFAFKFLIVSKALRVKGGRGGGRMTWAACKKRYQTAVIILQDLVGPALVVCRFRSGVTGCPTVVQHRHMSCNREMPWIVVPPRICLFFFLPERQLERRLRQGKRRGAIRAGRNGSQVVRSEFSCGRCWDSLTDRTWHIPGDGNVCVEPFRAISGFCSHEQALKKLTRTSIADFVFERRILSVLSQRC